MKYLTESMKSTAYVAAGAGVGYGIVPAAAGYMAAQKASHFLFKRHAEALAYNAAMRIAPHVAAGVAVALPFGVSAAFYLCTGLLTAAHYAMKKTPVVEPVKAPIEPMLSDECIASPATQPVLADNCHAVSPAMAIEPVLFDSSSSIAPAA